MSQATCHIVEKVTVRVEYSKHMQLPDAKGVCICTGSSELWPPYCSARAQCHGIINVNTHSAITATQKILAALMKDHIGGHKKD